ncbi:Biotin biosynthesis cytochrome P450 [Nocardioides aquaticus]|uniref:Biotin biosynthesis cytochrome P450 n=1 Tax=Nocardioides aquaticus TaxID=160826 RepID=A0ABX8EJM5_9ACTN|nr:cytochrome P450 [Nocardioides aquaticus]QVT78828.1 Biotin biosynthesis cytochrome P450 [Nocardioides aquaticus]
MRSVPTTSADLTDPGFLADPYPVLAALRAQGPVLQHEPTGRWLVLDHAGVGRALRDRRLGRVWRDREPADALAPFNLLHRHQMMENEPPDHTRLRRPVAAAFNRGHVERLRPRVRELAAGLLDEVAGAAATDAGFDVVGEYAEPLPVLVIAELLGVPASHAPDLRAWSQAIVRMYETSPSPEVVSAAVAAAADFAALVRDLADLRRRHPADDLVSDLAATELSADEVVASAVLLLNAGHEASVNVFGNGLVGLLRAGRWPVAAEAAPTAVEEMLRHDAALQLFERTATTEVELAGGQVVPQGGTVALLLGSANRDPAVFADADVMDPTRDPNPHVSFGAGVHFCLGAPLARMELAESVALLATRLPGLALAGEPVRRPTFVLRGYEQVRVHDGGGSDDRFPA